MRYISFLLSVIIVLSGCSVNKNLIKDDSLANDAVMNTDIPVYRDKNGLYFIRADKDETGAYYIVFEDNTGNQKDIIYSDDFINDLYVKDDNIYYSRFDDNSVVHIWQYNTSTRDAVELFCVPSSRFTSSFIYISKKYIYYFGNHCLWSYSKDNYNQILSDIDTCIIVESGIYYAKGNDIYFMHKDTAVAESILTKQEIYDSGCADSVIQASGGSIIINNLILVDGNLYFSVCDANFRDYSSKILKFDMQHHEIYSICDNIVGYGKFQIQNEKIYVCGRHILDLSTGIFQVNEHGIKCIVDYIPTGGIYVYNENIYYYKLSDDYQYITLIKQ